MPRIAGIQIEGVSTAAVETCIELPELGVVFDMGCCPRRTARHDDVFLSHGHVDHCGAVAQHAGLRGLNSLPGARYHVLDENASGIDAMFTAFDRLAGATLPRQVAPLSAGQSVRLRRDLVARSFPTDHRVPSQGYLLFRHVDRLKAEHRDKHGSEIAKLKADGVAVTEPEETPLVAFSGDTRIEAIEGCDAARKAKLLVLEVTFLDPSHPVSDARRRGHIHLDEVIERAAMFENEAILFMHFSARYTADDVRRLLDARLPDSLRSRVHALL